jgi:hypothetical protein
MTYRELINSVLRRLREDTIDSDWSGDLYDSNTVTDYQKLIGELVNDAKKNVESYHDWQALRETFNIKTKAGNMQYTLGDATRGAGVSFKVLDVINQSNGTVLTQVSNAWLNDKVFPLTDIQEGEPLYYALNGISQASTGREPDFNVDLYPVPNSVQTISFNIVGAQKELTEASQVLRTPSQPTILGAWARAAAERGEDGGTISSAISAEAREVLVMAIQLDSSNMEYERDWVVN